MAASKRADSRASNAWIAHVVRFATLCAWLSAANVCAAQDLGQNVLRQSAQESLTGPSIALGTGLALIVAAPLVAIRLALATAWDSNPDEGGSGKTDPTPIALGVGMTLVGSAITAWGIAGVVQIRSARRRLARLDSASLGYTPGGAQLALRFRY